jgi:beta-galactosidase
MHSRVIDRTTFLREAIPQLGWNVRGYLYWQFRPERLGMESPAWGLIRPDGTDKPVTVHAKKFIQKLTPYLPELLRTRRNSPVVGILKSRRNELYFNGFPQNKGNWLYRSIRGWLNALLKTGIPFRFVSQDELENGQLDSLKLLILPAANYMSQKEADAADAFLQGGGALIAEGSVASYCHDDNRYSTVVPGCGLAEKWGLKEIESVSSFHLDCSGNGDTASSGVTGDTAKALSSVKAKGGEFLPLKSSLGNAYGALNLSVVAGPNLDVIASFQNQNCVVEKSVGKGHLIYAGTYLGIAAAENSDSFVCNLLNQLGLSSEKRENDIYITPLCENNIPRFFCVENRSAESSTVSLPGKCLDVFNGNTGEKFQLPAASAALFKVL